MMPTSSKERREIAGRIRRLAEKEDEQDYVWE